ncbi:uncharacterized protein CLUP02_05425 [Colletotrichum lupini]|uniref:Uncharacterized protein n=1 Tax=Colletotrichum lupini TaxID=145971 RepID=A0A9Q8WE18_9PEZI|nr:uncharacterized protein CLUP02_05425 [Colletotrichum lupini]UQC79944.1 hypothetical protein CLUP02_05425 [Colletotrichum lupini]
MSYGWAFIWLREVIKISCRRQMNVLHDSSSHEHQNQHQDLVCPPLIALAYVTKAVTLLRAGNLSASPKAGAQPQPPPYV